MSDTGKKGFSPWWSLLILPVAAAIGWAIGFAPTKSAPPAAEPAPEVASNVATDRGAPPAIRVDTAPARDEAANPAPAKPPAELSNWSSYESALEESRRTGKPILLDFNADWCGPCRRLKSAVFDDPGFGRRVQLAVIPVSVKDRYREEGRNPDDVESLQQRWRIEAFPTLIVFSPATGMSEQIRGFGGAEYTAGWIEQSAQRVR